MNVPNGHIIGVRLRLTGGGDTIATSLRHVHPLNRSVLQFLFYTYEDVRKDGVTCKIQDSTLPLRSVHP